MTATTLAPACRIASMASSLAPLLSGTLSETSFFSGLSKASNSTMVSIVRSRVWALSLIILPFYGSTTKITDVVPYGTLEREEVYELA